MDKERALEIFIYLRNHAYDDFKDLDEIDKEARVEIKEAVTMAISALEQEPCDDAISLADAKEIIARNDSTNGSIAVFTGKQVQQMLDTLPRIMTKPIECDDAISREAVLGLFYDLENLYERIKQLPSVQPSRKGHWIETEYHRYS